MIDKAYDHCRQILSDNSEKLQQLVDYLLEHESITGEQFEALMEGREIMESSTTSMFDRFEDAEDAPAAIEEPKPETHTEE